LDQELAATVRASIFYKARDLADRLIVLDLDENTVKSGHATSRAAAMSKVVWLIDKALKKANPKPPTTSKWS
jgi:hypothetical protein